MLREKLMKTYSNEVHEAWSIVFDFMVEKMAEGANALARSLRNKRGTQHVTEHAH